MNEEQEKEETIGELYDRLPPGVWVHDYGLMLKRVPELPEGMDQELEWEATQ